MERDRAEQIFAGYLSRNGLRMTNRRRLIFGAFYRRPGHVSAEDIYNDVSRSEKGIGIATVWRTMRHLQKAGLADEVFFRDGVARYEKRKHDFHGHLICSRCGEPFEFSTIDIIPQLREVAQARGFKADDFKISISGLCSGCLNHDSSGELK